MEWLFIVLKMIPIEYYIIGSMLILIFGAIYEAFKEEKETLKVGLIIFVIIVIIMIGHTLYSTVNRQIANYTRQKIGYITIFDLNASQLKVIDDFNTKKQEETKKLMSIYKANQEREEEIQKQKIIREIK